MPPLKSFAIRIKHNSTSEVSLCIFTILLIRDLFAQRQYITFISHISLITNQDMISLINLAIKGLLTQSPFSLLSSCCSIMCYHQKVRKTQQHYLSHHQCQCSILIGWELKDISCIWLFYQEKVYLALSRLIFLYLGSCDVIPVSVE